MKRPLTTLLLFTVALLSVSCSYSNMLLDDERQLVISNDESKIKLTTKRVERERINLGKVYVDQMVLAADDERCIVYEDIRTANGYRFNYSYKRSIDLIFNAYRVDTIKRYGDLTLYRLTLRDKERSTLNLLALTASKQSLKLVYGFDDERRTKIEKDLEHNSTVIYSDLSFKSARRDHCIKSLWQPRLLILDNLIVKKGGGLRIGQ